MYDLQGADGSSAGGQRYSSAGPYQQPSAGGFTFTSGGFPGSSPGGNQWFDPTTGTFTQSFSSSSFGGAGGGGGGMGDIFEMMERMFGGGAGGSAGGGGMGGGSGGNPFASFTQKGGQSQKGKRSTAGPGPRSGPGTGAQTKSSSGSKSHSGADSAENKRSRHARSADKRTDAHSGSSASVGKGRSHTEQPHTSTSKSGHSYAHTGQTRPTVVSVECTLEELYSGKVKSLKVRDKVPVGSEIMAIEKVYKVDIKPGYKSGTKVKFPATEEFPKPVEFEVTEVKHKYFTRVGDNLHWVCKLLPKQVTKGVTVKVPLLDGTTLTFDSKDYEVKDGAKATFKGKGMPLSSSKAASTGRTHGDLVVKFEVA
jgi:DnaJ family protein B protein 4